MKRSHQPTPPTSTSRYRSMARIGLATCLAANTLAWEVNAAPPSVPAGAPSAGPPYAGPPAPGPTKPTSTARQSADSRPSEVLQRYDKPRIRYVHGTKAMVRSGPSDQYYSTSSLAANSLVEVYMETTDGWSGIRPPAGSHNWVAAKNAYLLPGGKLAEISNDETPAWVGSTSEDMKQLFWQTGLKSGQQVQVIGEDFQRGEDGAKQLWYQISPPQGEFRWIRTALLVDHAPGIQKAQPSKSGEPEVMSPVQTASFQQPTSSGADTTAVENTQNGDIVWSNESEVLAKINKEIKAEQNSIANQMRSQGIPVSTSRTNSSDQNGSILVDGAPIEESHIAATDPSPMLTPAQQKRAKQIKAAQHQIDSFAQWDAMEQTEKSKLKARPLASLLGLVGFGIVEADRVPVATEMARARHEWSGSGHLPRPMGTESYGTSRLDRLPRPGRRPSMPYSRDSQEGMDLEPYYGSEFRPLDENRPMLDRLLQSNQPLFGQDRMAMTQNPGPNPAMSGYGRDSLSPDWHGLRSQRVQSVSEAMNQAFDEPLDAAEFGTPEMQRAMLELSGIVSRPTEEWDLSRIRERCEQWIDRGQTALVRGEARLLMDRIDQFEQLRIRTMNRVSDGAMLAANAARQSISNGVSAMNASYVQPASATGVNQGASFAAPSMQEPGDASGWLVQVHSSFPGQPDFALTDDAGQVITYVRSTAALNLRRYLQQPVMIQGARGYIPSLAAKQIVAERVVRLR